MLRPFVLVELRLHARHHPAERIEDRLGQPDLIVIRPVDVARYWLAAPAITGEYRLVGQVVRPKPVQRKVRRVVAVGGLRATLAFSLPGLGLTEGRLPARREHITGALLRNGGAGGEEQDQSGALQRRR